MSAKKAVLWSVATSAILGCSDPASVASVPDARIDATNQPDQSRADAPDASTADLPVDLGRRYPCAAYARRGPYDVGLRTMMVDDVPLAVFYPAASGSAQGPRASYEIRDWLLPEDQALIPDERSPIYEFDAYEGLAGTGDAYPVVLFSHGLAGYRFQNATMLSHIASWGFVAVAPEHEERNLTTVLRESLSIPDTAPSSDTLRAVLTDLRMRSAAADASVADMDVERVAAIGHSAGGSAVMRIGADGDYRFVASYGTGNASAPASFAAPTLVIGGDLDKLSGPPSVRELYTTRDAPATFALLEQTGHLAFSDICAIGVEEGGILQLAVESGVDVPVVIQILARDGCGADYRPLDEVWPIVHHETVAQLRRWVSDEDDALDMALQDGCFGEAVFEMESRQ